MLRLVLRNWDRGVGRCRFLMAAPALVPTCGVVALPHPCWGLIPEELVEGAFDGALVLVQPKVFFEQVGDVFCELACRLVRVVGLVVSEPTDGDQKLPVRGHLVADEPLGDVVRVIRKRLFCDAVAVGWRAEESVGKTVDAHYMCVIILSRLPRTGNIDSTSYTWGETAFIT